MNLALAPRPSVVTVEAGDAFVTLDGVTKVFGHGKNVTPALVMWKSLYNWAHRSGITFVPVADSDMRMYGGYLTLT